MGSFRRRRNASYRTKKEEGEEEEEEVSTVRQRDLSPGKKGCMSFLHTFPQWVTRTCRHVNLPFPPFFFFFLFLLNTLPSTTFLRRSCVSRIRRSGISFQLLPPPPPPSFFFFFPSPKHTFFFLLPLLD